MRVAAVDGVGAEPEGHECMNASAPVLVTESGGSHRTVDASQRSQPPAPNRLRCCHSHSLPTLHKVLAMIDPLARPRVWSSSAHRQGSSVLPMDWWLKSF